MDVGLGLVLMLLLVGNSAAAICTILVYGHKMHVRTSIVLCWFTVTLVICKVVLWLSLKNGI